jgi:Tfp pilus assembly protein PilO
MSSEAVASIPARRPFRLRFSLLALLVLVTLACLILGWWQFIHLERQRLIRRRDLLEQRVNDMSTELKRKWEDYLDIAKGLDAIVGDGGKQLLQFDLKRLDRIDAESMRIKGELWELQAKGNTSELEFRKQRLSELVKQEEGLKKELEVRARSSATLETLRADLDQLQHMINEFTEELERLKLEAEVRGIPPK